MKTQKIKTKYGTIIADTDYLSKTKQKKLCRPPGPLTPSGTAKEITALNKLLEDGDIDMKQFHALKDSIIARPVEGK